MLNKIFGETAAAKLLDYFLDLPQKPFTRQELSIRSQLSVHVIDQLVPVFLKYNVLKVAEQRKMNYSTKYKVDEKSATFNALINLDFVISEINNQVEFNNKKAGEKKK